MKGKGGTNMYTKERARKNPIVRLVAWIGAISLVILPFIIIFGLFGIIGGFCFPYALNSWLVFFGKAPTVVFWQGFILGICPYVGQASIPVAVITFIAMLIL